MQAVARRQVRICEGEHHGDRVEEQPGGRHEDQAEPLPGVLVKVSMVRTEGAAQQPCVGGRLGGLGEDSGEGQG